MRNFLRLCRRQWRLAFVALLAVICTRLALWVLPYRWLHRWAHRPFAARRGEVMRRLRIARAVAIASRLVPGASCLTQALAALRILRWRGEDAKLCVGMRRGSTGQLEAHAWLEHEGGVLIGELPDLQGYRSFRPTEVAA
jgi:hypothetical protein